MRSFIQTSATILLDATSAGATAAAVTPSHLLLSNTGTTWLQFTFLPSSTAPVDRTSGGAYIPVAPGAQLLVANGAPSMAYWGAFGGGKLLVTPGSITN